jgi:general bacterial porin, GBP family
MKKSLLALAVLGAFAGSAVAQSSVTLYGIADANFTSQKGGTNTRNAIDSGGLNGNRWGLRGTEDLGGGLKANFVLESGFTLDNGLGGQSTQTNAAVPATSTSPAIPAVSQARLFGRAAWVGVSGGFGEVRIGRHLTPIGSTIDSVSGGLGTRGADVMPVARTIGGTNGRNLDAYRTDNSVNYITPNLGGLTAHLQYSTQVNGAENVGLNKEVGQHYGVNVMYKGGPVAAGVAYLAVTDAVAQTLPSLAGAGKQKVNSLFAFGSFDARFAKFTLAYNQDDFSDLGNVKDPTTIGIGADVPLGPVVLSAAYAKVKDSKGVSGGASDDADIYTVQAVYDLSKRTALYAFYTGVKNDAGADLGYNSPALGKRSSLLQFGVRHRF